MKKLMPLLMAVASLPGVSFAQGLVGTWQGTLSLPAPANRDLRLVFKIATTDNDALKGTMYSIDQPAPPLPGTVTKQGSTVKIAIPAAGGTYEGKVSPDGNSMTGTWAQGPNPLPLTLARATDATAWAIPEPPKPLKPMKANANLVFEVATIKPSKPDARLSILVRGRQFTTSDTSLSDLISFAYRLHGKQLAGGPAWLESEKYDLAAEPEAEGAPSTEQLRVMIQKLLVDRFGLKFHYEKKELSVYAIAPGKSAPTLTKSDADPNSLPALGFRALGKFTGRNVSMGDFASFLQSLVLDRPVVNQTALTDKYDFTLDWTPDQSQFVGLGAPVPAPTDDPAAPPDLFTAFQKQLGLKLESTKAAVDVMVIDTVEKPSAN